MLKLKQNGKYHKSVIISAIPPSCSSCRICASIFLMDATGIRSQHSLMHVWKERFFPSTFFVYRDRIENIPHDDVVSYAPPCPSPGWRLSPSWLEDRIMAALRPLEGRSYVSGVAAIDANDGAATCGLAWQACRETPISSSSPIRTTISSRRRRRSGDLTLGSWYWGGARAKAKPGSVSKMLRHMICNN